MIYPVPFIQDLSIHDCFHALDKSKDKWDMINHVRTSYIAKMVGEIADHLRKERGGALDDTTGATVKCKYCW